MEFFFVIRHEVLFLIYFISAGKPPLLQEAVKTYPAGLTWWVLIPHSEINISGGKAALP